MHLSEALKIKNMDSKIKHGWREESITNVVSTWVKHTCVYQFI